MNKARFKVALVIPHGMVNSGLRLLAAILRRDGFECDTIFAGSWINNAVRMPSQPEIDALVELLASRKPDLIGLNIGSPYLAWARWVLAEVRDRLGKPTVVGGIHPTLCPEDFYGHADFICVGEGEEALVELAAALRDGQDCSRIHGLHVRQGLKYHANPLRPFIDDLDRLPPRDFLDDGRFMMHGQKVISGEPLRHARWLRVYASRGCPYACEYCYNSSLKAVYGHRGNFHRIHSVEWTINEVQHARRYLPKLKKIIFDDDTFIFPGRWLGEFCDRWPKEVGLPFDILAHPDALSEKKLTQLKSVGLVGAQVGIQAASEAEAKQLYNRSTGADKNLAFARLLRKLGVNAVYDVILDNPQATDQDHDALLKLLSEMPRPYRLFLYSLNFFPKAGVSGSLNMPPEHVEGRSQYSLRQFRMSLDWPRPPKERLFVALVSIISKPLIRPAWVWRAWRNRDRKQNLRLIMLVAIITNWMRLGWMGLGMLFRRELAWYKLREYAHPTRTLTQ